MRWISVRGWIVAGSCLASCVATPVATQTNPLRDLTEQDAASWKRITTALLTPDGQWLAYVSSPALPVSGGGESTVILRSVNAGHERRYPAGNPKSGAGILRMSASGRWVAFNRAVESSDTSRPKQFEVVLVELNTGAQREFKTAHDFEFVGDVCGEWLILKRYRSDENNQAFDLTVEGLTHPGTRTLDNVTDFASHSPRAVLASVGTHGMQVYNLSSGRTQMLDASPGSTYEKLTWSRRGTALAAVRRGKGGDALLAFTHLEQTRARKAMFEISRWTGFPAGYRLAGSVLASGLKWREDEAGLFFDIEALPESSAPDPYAVPNLLVWNWRDEHLPLQKKFEAAWPRPQWCFAALARGRFVRLSDDGFQAEPHVRGHYVLGYDAGKYGWLNRQNTFGGSLSQKRDYYLVDIEDGRRTPVLRQLQVAHASLSIPPQLSPDGSVVLYQDSDADYSVYIIASGIRKKLTAKLPTRFYLPDNDFRGGRQMQDGGNGVALLQGWTRDGAYVLISDNYDIWALPLKAGHAVNLTGNGRAQQIAYRRITLTRPLLSPMDADQIAPDLSAPMYLEAFDFKTGKQGLMRWTPEARALEVLHWDFADVSYHQAPRADVYLVSRQTSVESLDYYRASPDWTFGQRLTDINPQQRKFRWSPGSRYLTYTTSGGETRHAILHLPVGYTEGRAYPAIVEIYEGVSQIIHSYVTPFYIPVAVDDWLRRGYAVLLPDIVPRLNEAGPAAVEAISAAIAAAAQSGAVDRERLGLYGFSFGGYETLFTISRANLFRAAVSQAGMSNLWSYCNGPYGPSQWPGYQVCQIDQPYLSGPWWEQWQAYIGNSGLYHAADINTPLLLVHGTQDTRVPFSQSVEIFNTLRAMGKPVALLEYQGEEHSLTSASMRDAYRRIQEFFDSFLQDSPAPVWLGASFTDPAS